MVQDLLYKDRSEGGGKKKKVKKDKSKLEMGENILSFPLGCPGLEKRLSALKIRGNQILPWLKVEEKQRWLSILWHL